MRTMLRLIRVHISLDSLVRCARWPLNGAKEVLCVTVVNVGTIQIVWACMSKHTYENVDKSKVIWICEACGEPNYSACHLFTASTIDTWNSFDSLGSLNSDGSLSLGSPRATSSPVDKPIKTPYSFNSKKKKQTSLRILVINFQSVRAKREASHAFIDNNKPHVVIWSESWLNESITNNEVFSTWLHHGF